jgi:SPX domain protein involved in polyphosphate accumulation
MKFGKEFRIHLEETLPEWRDKYLCYKLLKKLLKNIPGHDNETAADAPPLVGVEEWFVNILSEELDKFNDFYCEKEEDFIIRFQELKERIESVKEKSCKDGLFTYEGEFSDEVMNIRKDFVNIHGEMVLLKNYSSLNFAGIIKILKKYDKRTGGLLRLPFTQVAVRQPFFTTEPLTRLVYECEANLEILFPLEAEVVESSSNTSEQKTDVPTEAQQPSSSLADENETLDVYRVTLAAIKTIQGLKKESSTSNPLSFGSIFGKQDNDSSGAVTSGNSSDSDSKPNQDDAGSDK